jgi:hypothetical protein|tara:strand:- start:2088 stop:2336 length:249 start_codon:yes stop_codon:yes gene_type:complete
LWRHNADDILRPNQQAALMRITYQHTLYRHLMISAPPKKAHTNNQRCFDPGQAFFKIRTVLFGNAVEPFSWHLRLQIGRERV